MLQDIRFGLKLLFKEKALVAGALMTVAFVASLIPSLRAIRIHPSVALRYE
jgi:ABC-type lipoprotein release transport system permease subunit